MTLSQHEDNQIQRLLDLLQEEAVIIKRMMLISEQLEKTLRGRLNEEQPPLDVA